MKTDKFEINFFEFSFLVEACLPQVPIARSMFFDSISEKYYHLMSKTQRRGLYNWIFKGHKDNKHEDFIHFCARFNPENQFKVTTDYKNKIEEVECYIFNGKYHLTKSESILKKYIIKIEKI